MPLSIKATTKIKAKMAGKDENEFPILFLEGENAAVEVWKLNCTILEKPTVMFKSVKLKFGIKYHMTTRQIIEEQTKMIEKRERNSSHLWEKTSK